MITWSWGLSSQVRSCSGRLPTAAGAKAADSPNGRVGLGTVNLDADDLAFADGKLTLPLSHDEPADPGAKANWLPAPADQFCLAIRATSPARERPVPVRATVCGAGCRSAGLAADIAHASGAGGAKSILIYFFCLARIINQDEEMPRVSVLKPIPRVVLRRLLFSC